MDNNNASVSKMADLFQLGSQGRQLLKDQVTPHKVALIVLMRDYCVKMLKPRDQLVMEQEEEYTEKEERDFIFTLLQLIQSADLELKELVQRVQEVAKPRLLEGVLQGLQELSVDVRSLMDLFQTLPQKLYLDSLPLLHKTSVLGLFVRRMVIAFDKLSFSLVTKLFGRYKTYYNNWAKMQQKSCDDEMNDLDEDTSLSIMDLIGPGDDKFQVGEPNNRKAHDTSTTDSGKYSQRQAEFFIAQQGALLQHNEFEAMSPRKLQLKVMELLSGNPELAEAHFLSYLNHLRVLEYCGAVDSLHHYFDRQPSSTTESATASVKSKPDDETSIRGFRYAALNMAALQYRFGHRSEALAAIQEAIRMAQEANDHICLQHALGWLERLGGEACSTGTAYLLERLITKAGELNLPYLTSLGVQAFAQHNALSQAQPSSVFEFLVKSDVVNCQHSQADLMCSSYSQKAALWLLYGNREMCSLSTQLMLNLNTLDLGVFHNGEAECLALCHLARLHADQGEYSWARLVLTTAKQRFPVHTQHSQVWMLCEQQVQFHQALLHRSWAVAEQALVSMAAVHSQEADYCRALMLKEKGEMDSAHQLLQHLQETQETGDHHHDNQHHPELQARLLLLTGELFSVAGDATSATQPLLTCLTLAKQHHFTYLVAMTTLHLAFVQFILGLPQRAILLLEEMLVMLLTHGSIFDCARAHYLWARCQVAAVDKQNDKALQHKTLLTAVEMMHNVVVWFRRAEAHFHTKDAIYYLARLYHQLGFNSERNKYALEFRQLDQQYPTWHQSQAVHL